jgi:hypothetical protein
MLCLLWWPSHVPQRTAQEAVAAPHRPRVHAAQEVGLVEHRVERSNVVGGDQRERKSQFSAALVAFS